MRGRRITFQESERLMPIQETEVNQKTEEACEEFIHEDCYSEDLPSESNSVNENVWNIGLVLE